MFTDDDLRELVEAAAAAAPDPDELDVDAFAAAAPRRARSFRGPLVTLGAAGAVLVVVLLGATVFSGGSTTNKPSASGSKFSIVANSIGGEAPTTTAPTGGGTAGATAGVAAAAGGAAGAAAGPGTPNDSPVPAQVPAVPRAPVDSAKVIKNGTLEVRVAKGAVTESMNRLTALATGFGGYVSETRTTANDAAGSQASATISLRVPAGAFEQLLAEASKLGEVRSASTSGQDVTAQFTDIDAQLQALNQTRDQFLLVLGEAKNVGDILAVQDRITQVQTQIDQLEGQKRLLTDQTSFGTLSITLLEPGATAAVPVVKDDGGFGEAWREARDHFTDGVETIVAASGTIVLVALCGGVLLFFGWLVVRRVRLRLL